MAYDPKVHHRRSIRLRGHDYRGGGAYFITTCIKDKTPMFGQIVETEMAMFEPGQIIENLWLALPRRFPSVVLDALQVMPNHFHGVIVIPGPGLDASLAKATGAPVVHPSRRKAPALRPAGARVTRTDVGPWLAPGPGRRKRRPYSQDK